LAICKGLCEAMSGDISYSSVPGEGTTFTCHLVLPHSTRALDFEEEQCGGLRVAETMAQRQVLEGVKILLVEDNPISQMVGVRLLTKLGVAVKVGQPLPCFPPFLSLFFSFSFLLFFGAYHRGT
jgi:hypothetical protein